MLECHCASLERKATHRWKSFIETKSDHLKESVWQIKMIFSEE